MANHWHHAYSDDDYKQWSAGVVGEQKSVETTLTRSPDGWQIHGFITRDLLVGAQRIVAMEEQADRRG